VNFKDIESLSKKTRADGARLFGVCETIYEIAMVGIGIVAFIGFIASVVAGANIFFLGCIIAVCTVGFCFMSYMLAVIATHVSKVMVHTSFSSIAILEHLVSENRNALNSGDEENKDLSENEVSLEELNEVTAAGVHAGDERLRVQSINDTCDSFKSRLKVGDVIVSFGSMQIYSIKSLRLAIKSAGNTPNDADFTVLRDGKIGLLELKKLSDDIAANLVTMETITI